MRRSAILLIVLATLIGFVATFAVWAKRQLLETSTYTETSTQLLEDEDIQKAVAGFLVAELYENVDVQAELQKVLPPQAQALAGPAAGALQQLANEVALRALERPAVQTLWQQANEQAHTALLNVVEGGGDTVSTEGGDVTLDLSTLVAQIGSQLGIDVADKLPPDAGQLEILKSDELSTIQDLVDLLQKLALILPLATFGLWGLAIYIAGDHRRQAVRAVGFSWIVIGVAVLAVRGMAGNALVDSLTSTASVEPAARSAWDILTSLLEAMGDAAIAYGVAFVLGAWLAGPGTLASEIRRAMTPGLRDRKIAYGTLAILMLLLFWWDPTVGTHRLVPSVILIALAVIGLEGLRAKAVSDFPNETWQPGGLRAAFAASRDRRRAPVQPVAAGAGRVDELERLARLRDQGILDQAEFEREKSRLLSQG
jgi:putative oligomerization/nucleic acid binding protein